MTGDEKSVPHDNIKHKMQTIAKGKTPQSNPNFELHGRKVILFMPWECPGKNYQKSEGYELIKVRRV